ncbi:hypothetical protein B5807_00590 [Epicoccum nigrum]|uniref:Uncharacterized protein n=1 Tax=Epicoccum nigrum TaxID=105696 RepID=A0A1Y2MDP7_EPING|nr:hypothetical protein B5807_00590 [Epicoccum nigrum]
MAFAVNPNAPAKTGPTYFQEYGLRIPRYNKQGKEILHARLAKELEPLGGTILRRIVETYDRSNGYQLVKNLTTDIAIARWIERVETLALGPHPESKLPSTAKEDLLVSLGFKKAKKAQDSQTKQDAPENKLNPQQAPLPAKAKAPQSQTKQGAPENKLNPEKASSAPKAKRPQSQIKQDTPEKKPNPQKIAPPPKAKAPTKPSAPPAPSVERKKEQELAKPSPISLQGGTPKDKRNPASNAAPLDAPQMPAKKKKFAASAPKPESTGEEDFDLEQTLLQELAAPSPPPQVTPAKNKRDNDENAARPDAPQAAVKKRKTEAASPTTSIPPPSTASIPTVRAGKAEATSPQPSPPPSSNHTDKEAPSGPLEEPFEEPPSDEPPFRAPGLHGRHDSFPPSDPSLLTGRGHRVPPSEWTLNLRYQSLRYDFYNRLYPFFPFLDRERRIRVDEHGMPELRRLRDMEAWMRAYRERWPGECVGHLWDCGCVNMGYYVKEGGGEASEEE